MSQSRNVDTDTKPVKNPNSYFKAKREIIKPQIGKFPILFEPTVHPIAPAKHHFQQPIPDFSELNQCIATQVTQKEKEVVEVTQHLNGLTYMAAAKKMLVASEVEFTPVTLTALESARFEIPALNATIVDSLGKFEHNLETHVPVDPLVTTGKFLITSALCTSGTDPVTAFRAMESLGYHEGDQSFILPATFYNGGYVALTPYHIDIINKNLVNGITIPLLTGSGAKIMLTMYPEPYTPMDVPANQVEQFLLNNLPQGCQWKEPEIAANLLIPHNLSADANAYMKDTLRFPGTATSFVFDQVVISKILSLVMRTTHNSLEKVQKKINMRSVESQDTTGSATQLTSWNDAECRVQSPVYVNTADYIIGALTPFYHGYGYKTKKIRFESKSIDVHTLRRDYAKSCLKERK